MLLGKELSESVKAALPEELLSRMGYDPASGSNLFRLQEVLADPWLGLADGEYDFVHDSRSFLLALCDALGMDHQACELRIDAIIEHLEAETTAFRPWLRVQSDEAEQAAGVGSGRIRKPLDDGRKLSLGTEAHRQPLERVIELASQAIVGHQRESGGRLPSGHQIDGYLLYYSEDRPTLRMDTEGMVLGTGPTAREPFR